MNVVFVRASLQKLDLVAQFYPKAHFLQDAINTFVAYSPSVFRRKHQAIQQGRDAVTLIDVIDSSPKDYASKGRGIYPP